ncbi:MAG: hypothetical protein H7Y42_00460 [Chitinophagaceae bacterium]|nr:hypothetical protein [Chitinophagaceae bacterium]
MRKRVEQIERKVTELVTITRIDEILPFTEKPSLDHTSKAYSDKNSQLGASDLFALFTADIIREEVVFTR